LTTVDARSYHSEPFDGADWPRRPV